MKDLIQQYPGFAFLTVLAVLAFVYYSIQTLIRAFEPSEVKVARIKAESDMQLAQIKSKDEFFKD